MKNCSRHANLSVPLFAKAITSEVPPPKVKTRKMFLLTKTKRPKKVHCNIIYSRKRFLKIKICSAERRSES